MSTDPMPPPRIAFRHRKGGTGKTSLAIGRAVRLAGGSAADLDADRHSPGLVGYVGAGVRRGSRRRWDAMLVEVARVAGVTRLLTEDMQDGRRVGALRLENPFKADFDLGLD